MKKSILTLVLFLVTTAAFCTDIMVEVDLDDVINTAGTEKMEHWLEEHASEWGYSYVGDENDCWG